MRAGQDRDKGIVQLLQRRVPHRLLVNVHMLVDGFEEFHLPYFDSQRCQGSPWRKVNYYRLTAGSMVCD